MQPLYWNTSMAIAQSPSQLSLPLVNPGVVTILEYLIIRFPHIDAQIWQQRMNDGKVHCHDKTLITTNTPFQPQLRVYYYREVKSEPTIPFKEIIIFQDEHILVAYKPHFLPVIPGGVFVNECLQTRLRRRTGTSSLQALHRLDRVTAGLVMFSVNPDSRHLYHQLFENRAIQKTYQAIANIHDKENLVGQEWIVKNRIEHANPRFRMQVVKTKSGGCNITKESGNNSHSIIRCLAQNDQQRLFELMPITGKTHQLRVHMQTLGWPILNDKYYPVLQPLSADDFSAPLQLLATKLEFTDPITKQARCFVCSEALSLV
jgi:tRNA pseudouridine32 synthase/23S rRNA pseudouridine746 synthase